ncbi:MAG: glucosyltransferase domain-containing protein, partial [Cyanobium sp.]
ALVVFGLALRWLWIPGAASVYGIATALIFALSPGLNNLWQYQVIHPAMTAFYCLAALALVSYSKGGWKTLASILAIGFTLSYQIMLSLYLVAILIMCAIRINTFFLSERPRSLRESLLPLLKLTLCLLAGLTVYVLISKIALDWSGLGQSTRTTIVGVDDLPSKVSQLLSGLKRLLYGRGEVYLPQNVKLIQVLLLSIALIATPFFARQIWHQWPRRFCHLLVLFLVLLAAAVSIRVPTIFFAYSPDNPRVLIGTAVFWSGIFAMATDAGPKILKRIALVLGTVLFAAYAIITNSVCSDFVRLNQRELLLASRIVERMSQSPDFENVRTVVVVGRSPQVVTDLRSTDLLWSGLNSFMGTGVLREASGERFESPLPADQELAKLASRQMPFWPSPGSTAIVNDVGIVVLGKPV